MKKLFLLFITILCFSSVIAYNDPYEIQVNQQNSEGITLISSGAWTKPLQWNTYKKDSNWVIEYDVPEQYLRDIQTAYSQVDLLSEFELRALLKSYDEKDLIKDYKTEIKLLKDLPIKDLKTTHKIKKKDLDLTKQKGYVEIEGLKLGDQFEIGLHSAVFEVTTGTKYRLANNIVGIEVDTSSDTTNYLLYYDSNIGDYKYININHEGCSAEGDTRSVTYSIDSMENGTIQLLWDDKGDYMNFTVYRDKPFVYADFYCDDSWDSDAEPTFAHSGNYSVTHAYVPDDKIVRTGTSSENYLNANRPSDDNFLATWNADSNLAFIWSFEKVGVDSNGGGRTGFYSNTKTFFDKGSESGLMSFTFTPLPNIDLSRTAVTTGLDTWYEFENDATDSQGNRDLTLEGSATYGDPFFGVAGLSLDDSTSDHADSTNLTQFSDDTVGTVSLWFKVTTDGGDEDAVFGINRNADATRSELTIDADYRSANDQILALLYVDGTEQWRFTTPANSLDEHVGYWVHLALVQNGKSPKLYLNGKEQTLTFATTTDQRAWLDDVMGATDPADTLTVGAIQRNSAVLIPFGGLIDDVRIYSTALTKEEVWNLFMVDCFNPITGCTHWTYDVSDDYVIDVITENDGGYSTAKGIGSSNNFARQQLDFTNVDLDLYDEFRVTLEGKIDSATVTTYPIPVYIAGDDGSPSEALACTIYETSNAYGWIEGCTFDKSLLVNELMNITLKPTDARQYILRVDGSSDTDRYWWSDDGGTTWVDQDAQAMIDINITYMNSWATKLARTGLSTNERSLSIAYDTNSQTYTVDAVQTTCLDNDYYASCDTNNQYWHAVPNNAWGVSGITTDMEIPPLNDTTTITGLITNLDVTPYSWSTGWTNLTLNNPQNITQYTKNYTVTFNFTSYYATPECWVSYDSGTNISLGNLASGYTLDTNSEVISVHSVSATCEANEDENNTVTKYFTIDDWQFVNNTYDTNVLEGSLTDFTATYYYNPDLISNFTLWQYWNGSLYLPNTTTAQNYSTLYYQWNNLLVPNIPDDPLNVTVPIIYNHTLTYTNSTIVSSQTDDSNDQNIFASIIDTNCALYPTYFMNISTYDEDTLGYEQTAVDLYFWVNDTEGNNLYSNGYELRGDTNYYICMYPNWGSYQLWADFRYWNSSITKREYFIENTTKTNATTLIDLYNIDDDRSEKTTVTVQDQDGNELVGYIVWMNRYYLPTDTYTTVAMIRTDFDGQSITYLNNTEAYQWIVLSNNTVQYTRSAQYLTGDGTLTITVIPASTSNPYQIINGVSLNITFDSTTNILRVQAIDSGSNMDTTTLNVTALGLTETSVCALSGTGITFDQTCDLSGQTGTIHIRLSGDFNGDTLLLYSDFLEIGTVDTYAGSELLGGLFIVGAVLFVGYKAPILVFPLVSMGLLIMWALGFKILSTTGLYGIAGVSLVFMFLFRRNE